MRQRAGRARRIGERRVLHQLVVDADLVRHPQAVGHLDDVDAVEERLVVLVVAEALPLRFVGVGEDDAVEGNRAEALRTLVVALLRRGEQRVQHLDRRLEHLDEFEQALVGAAETAGVAVGVGVVLGELLELADVELAHQRRDVLVVLVARLGLAHADLRERGRTQLDHAEMREVAAVLGEALDRPGRGNRIEVAPRDAVFLLHRGAVVLGGEEPERRLVHRRVLERVERRLLHQRLELFGQRALAAAGRAEQIDDLLALLQRLRRVLEVGDDLFDRLLHAVELAERGIHAHDLVREDAREPRIGARVDALGFADRHEHALGGGGVGGGIVAADLEVLGERVFLLQAALEPCAEPVEEAGARVVRAVRGCRSGTDLSESREDLRRVTFHANLREHRPPGTSEHRDRLRDPTAPAC